jgi:hypothetical protein
MAGDDFAVEGIAVVGMAGRFPGHPITREQPTPVLVVTATIRIMRTSGQGADGPDTYTRDIGRARPSQPRGNFLALRRAPAPSTMR